jgi:hypothetical protein
MFQSVSRQHRAPLLFLLPFGAIVAMRGDGHVLQWLIQCSLRTQGVALGRRDSLKKVMCCIACCVSGGQVVARVVRVIPFYFGSGDRRATVYL